MDINSLQVTYFKPIEVKEICDATTYYLPYNLPPINICIIPAVENIIAAIVIIICIIIGCKIFWYVYYEKKYYKGAGNDYFDFGSKYVKDMKKNNLYKK